MATFKNTESTFQPVRLPGQASKTKASGLAGGISDSDYHHNSQDDGGLGKRDNAMLVLQGTVT